MVREARAAHRTRSNNAPSRGGYRSSWIESRRGAGGQWGDLRPCALSRTSPGARGQNVPTGRGWRSIVRTSGVMLGPHPLPLPARPADTESAPPRESAKPCTDGRNFAAGRNREAETHGECKGKRPPCREIFGPSGRPTGADGEMAEDERPQQASVRRSSQVEPSESKARTSRSSERPGALRIRTRAGNEQAASG